MLALQLHELILAAAVTGGKELELGVSPEQEIASGRVVPVVLDHFLGAVKVSEED